MSSRFFGLVVAGAVVIIAWALPPASAAQAPAQSVCPDNAHAAFHACATAAMKTFTPPRTASGQPDFSGFWRRRASAHESLEAHVRTPDDSGGPSAVVDPADGLVPMQPWADERRRENAERYLHHNAACFQSGVPVTMYMTGLYQFLQTGDHLAVLSEEAHGVRIIPLDGRPHIGPDILLWQGDSLGRWEGNTLVIETTNQNARPYLDQRGRFYTEEAEVVERLTMVDANTLHYQATIDDPNVYTRPFTIAIAFRRNEQQGTELWEEACYEGNDLSMSHFRARFDIYPGITAAEARELRSAWEAREGAR